jgi:hypothetical protein
LATKAHEFEKPLGGKIGGDELRDQLVLQDFVWSTMGSGDFGVQGDSRSFTVMSVKWADLGCPVFQLGHSLTAALLMTSPRGLHGRDMTWPFDAFCVAIPPGFLRMVGAKEEEDVRFIFLARFTSTLNSKPTSYTDESFREARLPFYIQWCVGESRQLLRHTTELKPDEPVERWLRDQNRNIERMEPLDYECQEKSNRLLVNLAIYLATLRAAGSWNPKRQMNGKPFKPSQARVWGLGSEVKLPAQLRAAAANGTAGTRRFWKLNRKFVVRGHFRHCGAEKVLRWIQPYWKGPQEGTILERTYDVSVSV